MTFSIGMIVLAVLGTGVIVLWMALGSKFAPVEQEQKVVLETDERLKKMTKSQLEKYASDLGVQLDKGKTKAVMISDLKSAV